ncbi:MAG: hypothetical protein RIR62_1760 [Pseudomonadota bacterium]
MILFSALSLAPLGLLALAGWQGGLWVWLAVLALSAMVVALDLLLPPLLDAAPEGAEFPGSDALLVAAGAGALLLLPLAVAAVATGRTGWVEGAALMLASGWWLGQVAHPAAHELIHRADRRLFRLGQAVYAACLMGHHASAHRLVHHVHVATPDDPATARAGEGFWRFLLRAEVAGFRAGLAAENARRARAARAGLHPYALYAAGAGLALALAFAIGGGTGVALWLLLGLHFTVQVHLSDYVQHYGLTRARLPDGRAEPVSSRHSWNAAQWYSSHMMLNAPRHSDHHAHPSRPYPALRVAGPEEVPHLPWPLPLACMIALFPPLWRRRMKPLVARWREAGPAGPTAA